jgi:hypothetical protein
MTTDKSFTCPPLGSMQLVAKYCIDEFGVGETIAPIKKQATCIDIKTTTT